MSKTRFFTIAGIVLFAAALRLIPHPSNFAPITAIALFGGAQLSSKRLAFLVPLLAMFLSDLVIGFHEQMFLVYGCFMVAVGLGIWAKNKSVSRLAVASLGSSFLFFIVTNFGVWAVQNLYPKTAAGLLACYVAAIPFFQQTILGDAVFTAVLFGGFALAEKYLPALSPLTLPSPARGEG